MLGLGGKFTFPPISTYKIVMFWIILVLVLIGVFVLYKIRHKIKKLNLGCITFIDGGVKAGKTTLAVHLSIKAYKKSLMRYKIRSFFQKIIKIIFKKYEVKVDEKPLLYSNIPLSVPYVPITKDILLRKVRMAYKSVVLISESSLVIDSMTYNNPIVNEACSLFYKLFGHETRGGSLFVETQNISDNHFSFKRSIQSYIFIAHCIKIFPFFIVFRVREMLYSDSDNNVTNVFNEDIDETMKILFVSKRVWKKFDTYCYSKITDDLPIETNEIIGQKDLKLDSFVSFKEWKTIKKEIKTNETK